MLLQLYHAGILHVRRRLFSVALAAVRLMIMTRLQPGVSVRVSAFPPVDSTLTGLDFGHEQRTVTLPLGAHPCLITPMKALS